jgi:general secretion pathway protein A
MYESFYGLREKPFTTIPDPDFFYMSPKHEMALTYLEYGLTSQAGFMVLTGEVGSGKTTLLNYLIRKTDTRVTNVALIFNTNIQPVDLLENMLREWDIECRGMNRAQLYESLNTFLLQEYTRQHRVLLIIDEAQNLPFETLEEIRMLSNLNDEKVPLLHIILSGQPNLKERLNTPRLEQLRQRVTVHYHLEPLDRQETADYLQTRLQVAQARDVHIFSEDAVDALFACSRGIPRVINLICDLALVYGYAEQTLPVGRAIIDMVAADRQKMGLDFASSPFSGRKDSGHAGDPSAEQSGRLEKKIRELTDNMYDLALIVRKLVRLKDYVELHQREIQRVHRRVKSLEEKLAGTLPEKVYENMLRELENKDGLSDED